MLSRRGFLDDIDKFILNELQKDCRISQKELADKLNVATSTINYRIKRLEEGGILEGYYAKVNALKLGKAFYSAILIRVRYGPEYLEEVGKKIAEISEVKAVYYVLGENDFIILIRTDDQDEFMKKIQTIIKTSPVERSNSIVIANVIKEDFRIFFDDIQPVKQKKK
ncbi:MAG: Lrp/AsnC family transcriptional regulator [Promethearchaeota archaeon]